MSYGAFKPFHKTLSTKIRGIEKHSACSAEDSAECPFSEDTAHTSKIHQVSKCVCCLSGWMDEIFNSDTRQQLPGEQTCFLQRGTVERWDSHVCVGRGVGVRGCTDDFRRRTTPTEKKKI